MDRRIHPEAWAPQISLSRFLVSLPSAMATVRHGMGAQPALMYWPWSNRYVGCWRCAIWLLAYSPGRPRHPSVDIDRENAVT